ncbi:MAG: NAD-binding protein, partial [Marinilabiliaceae bacterium]
MDILIAGAGEVGTHLARLFSNVDHDVTLLDEDDAKLRRLSRLLDVMPVKGSVTSIRDLVEAGVKSADLFIAV